MGNIADFCKYKACRDYDQQLREMGWSTSRLTTDIESGVSIYIYDDLTGLLLFSAIDERSLLEIREQVGQSNRKELLLLAEKLSQLINDLADTPPRRDDRRLTTLAHSVAWFTGFLLAMVKKPNLEDRSIALFRLFDGETLESTFHMAYLDWPNVLARKEAERELSAIASMMQADLFKVPGY